MNFFFSLGLVLLGFILILIEIFFIPGINAIILTGLISILVGIYFAYSNLPGWEAHLVLFVSLGLGLVLFRSFFKSKAWSRFVLHKNASREEGFQSVAIDLSNLVGKSGITITHLRPSGRVQIENDFYDVISEGTFIEPQKPISVLKVEGNRIVVRQLKG